MGTCLSSPSSKKQKKTNKPNLNNEKIEKKSIEKRPGSFINVYDVSNHVNQRIEGFEFILLIFKHFLVIHNVEDPKEYSLKIKEKGNEFYKLKNYEKALELYNQAIVIPFFIIFSTIILRNFMTKTLFTTQTELSLINN